MKTLKNHSLAIVAAIVGMALFASPVLADGFDAVALAKPTEGPGSGGGGNGGGGNGGGDDGGGEVDSGGDSATCDESTCVYYGWMNGDVEGAWVDPDNGDIYAGQGVTITVVDDFKSSSSFWGDLGDTFGEGEYLRHGEWTLKQASMIAPLATMREDEFTRGGGVKLADGFNVLNLSYSIVTTAGYNVEQLLFGRQELSIISYAWDGLAFISKAAGNDGVGVGEEYWDGTYGLDGSLNYVEDYLNLALIGPTSVIFVGALDANGTVDDNGDGTGTLAWYSNTAGVAYLQYLVVGVESGYDGTYTCDGNDCFYNYDDVGTGLAGTSFAAPIISGYAAILASKFTDATPTDIVNRLLETARKDTIADYSLEKYGQGEASISFAIAPDYIN